MQKQTWLVVVGVLLTGIIGTSQSREFANETDFEAAMKDVGKNFGAVRSAMEAREREAVASGAENLVSIFEGVEAFFSARELEHGVTVAGQAIQAAADIKSAVDNGVLTDAEAKQVKEYDDLRYDAILTDAFTKDYLRDPVNHQHEDKRLESRVA